MKLPKEVEDYIEGLDEILEGLNDNIRCRASMPGLGISCGQCALIGFGI